MGCGPFRISRSTYDKRAEPSVITREVIREQIIKEISVNPNPKRYNIMRSRRFGKATGLGKFLLLEIQYPDCTNYEGRKILVFEDTALIELTRQGSIDPHFSNNPRFKSPMARFEPTAKGWNNAIKFCILMGNLS